MGKDLISRKDAIDALSTPHGILYPIRTIEDLPSVQPERKKGKWLMADDIPSICSNCGANWIDDYVDGRELYFTGKIPNFCPNCGNDNRGEQG